MSLHSAALVAVMTGRSNQVQLAMARGVHYKRDVSKLPLSNLQRFVFPAFLAVASIALSGASCKRQSANNPDEAKEARELVNAIDKVEGKKAPPAEATSASKTAPAQPAQPVNQEPLPGVSLDSLDDQKKERFYRLIDRTLQSPCGKAHSLRKSLTSDQECKRAIFAVRYVTALLEDEASDQDVQQFYEDHYKSRDSNTFRLEDTPYTGPQDAPVKLVEFYDYGCPACKEFAPMLIAATDDFTGQVAVFYKQFPLPSHPNSKFAAQAALAAMKQGKFVEMHNLLFAKSHQHQKSALDTHAKALGLDMARFESDYQAAAPIVQAHIKEGDAAGVRVTPTLYINGNQYKGPMHPRYMKLWIEEELAVNR